MSPHPNDPSYDDDLPPLDPEEEARLADEVAHDRELMRELDERSEMAGR